MCTKCFTGSRTVYSHTELSKDVKMYLQVRSASGPSVALAIIIRNVWKIPGLSRNVRVMVSTYIQAL